MVLLLASRFCRARNQEGLSKWVHPHVQNEGFGIAISSLAKFNKEVERKINELQKKDKTSPIKNEIYVGQKRHCSSLNMSKPEDLKTKETRTVSPPHIKCECSENEVPT